MYVRPWRAEIRFNKTGKMGPGNSGSGNLGSRLCERGFWLLRDLRRGGKTPYVGRMPLVTSPFDA